MTDIPHDLDASATPGDCHQADLVSAPKTIWAKPYASRSGVQDAGYWQNEPILPNTPANQGVEYRRWDLPRPEDAKRIRELEAALRNLDAAASRVAQLGAVTGPQWSKLAIASLQARAVLRDPSAKPKELRMTHNNGSRMQNLHPQRHAELGWSWGSYRDGICLTLIADATPANLAEFRAQAKEDGATVIDLRALKGTPHE